MSSVKALIHEKAIREFTRENDVCSSRATALLSLRDLVPWPGADVMVAGPSVRNWSKFR